MTIRYSGDVEIRLQYGGAGYLPGFGRNPAGSSRGPLRSTRRGGTQERGVYFDPNGEGFYYATIRAPYVRNAAILSFREAGLPTLSRKQATASDAYDKAALAFLKWAEKHVGELPVELDDQNRIVVHRVFQSPCPT